MHKTEQSETEEHLLISCPQNIDIRDELFQNALEIQPFFNNSEPINKVYFLMYCVNPLIYPFRKCIFEMMHRRNSSFVYLNCIVSSYYRNLYY